MEEDSRLLEKIARAFWQDPRKPLRCGGSDTHAGRLGGQI
jgi:hypothetical protein